MKKYISGEQVNLKKTEDIFRTEEFRQAKRTQLSNSKVHEKTG